MTDDEVRLVVGALLHDIGKVIYRQGDDKRKHSESGYDFLKQEVGLGDKAVLDSVLYHHSGALKHAQIEDSALAYIVYIADNIASAADRRDSGSDDYGFEASAPLQSVFNILNGNSQSLYYQPKTLDINEGINYPTDQKQYFGESFYAGIKDRILDNLRGRKWDSSYVNSLLEIMEATLSFVPSSTAKHEMADISLYDHVKLTAAVASCIYQYLQEKNITDYKNTLYINVESFYGENAFLLYSMDISGIQDFIYTISSKNALKTLRARSFYLEIMMEHIIDGLLDKLCLSRANLIYSGGGHCYILLANTENSKRILQDYNAGLNKWLMEQFATDLYVADGYAECSTNNLKNIPDGSYSQIFKTIGNSISEKKSRRYTAQDIIGFNTQKQDDYTRECTVCRRIGKVNGEGVCPLCSAMEKFSKNILYDEFFTVSLKGGEDKLPLPDRYYLSSDDSESLKDKMKNDDCFVRAYSKNKMYTGKHIATKLWVGSYTSGKNFGALASEAEGIERIAVLRADVDNLGQTFVSGFENHANKNKYVTLSRTATLSRQLSLFFKLYINDMLKNPQYGIGGRTVKKRNATICYSGGDDLFIVGSWNEVIELAVEIRRNFERYTQGTLSLSAGIGIYNASYPISVIATEVADMEDASKKLPEKNAVTIFSTDTYKWQEFEDKVLDEKLKVISSFFDTSEDRGKNFLYNLLELIRGRKEKINFARYVYLLSRLEPDKEAAAVQKENYREFSKNMYQWIKDDNSCRQLETAIIIYVYLNRDKEEK